MIICCITPSGLIVILIVSANKKEQLHVQEMPDANNVTPISLLSKYVNAKTYKMLDEITDNYYSKIDTANRNSLSYYSGLDEYLKSILDFHDADRDFRICISCKKEYDEKKRYFERIKYVPRNKPRYCEEHQRSLSK